MQPLAKRLQENLLQICKDSKDSFNLARPAAMLQAAQNEYACKSKSRSGPWNPDLDPCL